MPTQHSRRLQKALQKAAEKRDTPKMDTPAYTVIFNKNRKMSHIKENYDMDSNRLVTEFMILANIASGIDSNSVFHDTPPQDDIYAKKIEMLHESPGTYGLTSPIRRYSDLWHHRILAIMFNMVGADTTDSINTLTENLAQHLSKTETDSKKAKYAAYDRFASASLKTKIGKEFPGIITNITRAGLFIRLNNISTEVLLPISRLLPSDYYNIDRNRQKLTGDKYKCVYLKGAPITVRLKKSDPFTGSIIVEPIDKNGADISSPKLK